MRAKRAAKKRRRDIRCPLGPHPTFAHWERAFSFLDFNLFTVIVIKYRPQLKLDPRLPELSALVSEKPSPNSPVFYDPRGRRWRHVRRTYLILGVITTGITALFIASVLAKPFLPTPILRPLRNLPSASDIKLRPLPTPPPANAREAKARKAQAELQKEESQTKVMPGKRPELMPRVPPPANTPLPLPPPVQFATRPLSVGFYVDWDESSYASLERNLNHIDWLMPQWSHIVDAKDGNSPLENELDDPQALMALNLIREKRPQIQILPVVQNLDDEKWQAEVLARSLATADSRQRLIATLSNFVSQNKFAGVCVDFEEPTDETQPNLVRFMQELHTAFRANGWIVVQAVPFNDDKWNYKEYSAASDYLMLMAYDEHWSTGPEIGSVASQHWYEQNLSDRMRDIDPAKTIMALGNYGYDWANGPGHGKEVSFQEAVISSRDSQVNITFDEATRNPHFEFDEEDGSHHTIWFLDAVTAYNQMRAASGYRCAGFGLWRLGSEDPSIWSIFGSEQPTSSPDLLRRIAYGYEVDFEGSGELLQVVASPHDGWRDVKTDPQTGSISETYDRNAIPSSYVIERTGDHPGMIALTFDDGPDPDYTPAILDILKQENVPATFFVIGKNGQAYPDLLRRMVNEGHEVGNHTFTHPNLGEVPGRITKLELNATQRLIESITSRSTVLFRPPYFGDAEADKPGEVEPAIIAQNLGYIMVGVRIDPADWKPDVTPDEIVQRTIE